MICEENVTELFLKNPSCIYINEQWNNCILPTQKEILISVGTRNSHLGSSLITHPAGMSFNTFTPKFSLNFAKWDITVAMATCSKFNMLWF